MVKAITCGIAAVSVCALTGEAFAGGFSLRERSANAQGASFAGSTAAANDVTYSLFNPPALGKVRTIELGGAISGVFPDITGTARINGEKARPGVASPLASGAIGYRWNETVTFGLGIHSPFGLTTVYDDTFVGAADGIRSELISLAVTPMVAFNVTDDLIIGGGLSLIYNDPQLTRAVGVAPGGRVLEAKLNADQLTSAASFGVLWDATDTTRFGLSLHTGYNIETSGTLSAFDANLRPIDLKGTASIELPRTISFGVRQELTDDFTLLGEFEWANWSEFDAIRVNVPALAPNDDIGEVTDYKDSFFFAVGGEYQWNNELTLRAGVAYDETPTKRASRSLRIPDGDRIWASIGFSYQLNESMKIDAGYSVIFFEDSPLTIMNGPAAGSVIDYSGQTHIVSVGGTMTF